MGHLRLGRLPKTRKWIDVVNLLDDAPQDTAGIAAGVVNAADARLKKLASDPSLGYCFWLLTRVAWASRNPDFPNVLSSLGIETDDKTTIVGFISRVTERVHKENVYNTRSGHFSELSSLALRRALSESVIQHSGTLFEGSISTLQNALRFHSRPQQFGSLSHKFFADFFARTISSLVDRELSLHVGREKAYRTSADSLAFMQALDLHARESARIMEQFAADWYAKHNWQSKGEITREEAQGFVAIALRKLRAEFKQGAERN